MGITFTQYRFAQDNDIATYKQKERKETEIRLITICLFRQIDNLLLSTPDCRGVIALSRLTANKCQICFFRIERRSGNEKLIDFVLETIVYL